MRKTIDAQKLTDFVQNKIDTAEENYISTQSARDLTRLRAFREVMEYIKDERKYPYER